MKRIISVILFSIMIGITPAHSFANQLPMGTCEMTISMNDYGFENGVSPNNYCEPVAVGFFAAGSFHIESTYTGRVEYSGQKFTISNPMSPNMQEILTVYLVDANGKEITDYTRIAGNSRLDTAIEVSKKGWPNGVIHPEKSVILARADDPADALSASSLSGLKSAPILLTYPSKIDQSVLTELKRLNAKKVYIVGGTSAISKTVEDKLKGAGYSVNRLSGSSRFETAYKINEVVLEVKQTYKKAIIVNGYTVADALSASAYASSGETPIYLSEKNKLPVNLPKSISSVDIYGGTGVVSDQLANQLKGDGIAVKRISGVDRYSTSVAAAMEMDGHDMVTNTILVRGESTTKTKHDYPDAVVAASLASRFDAKILLVHPTKDKTEIKKYLEQKHGIVYVIGGEAAISTDSLDRLDIKYN
jgi:putative cell wall-binding protein